MVLICSKCLVIHSWNKLASSVDAIVISEIWKHYPLTDWLTYWLTGGDVIASKQIIDKFTKGMMMHLSMLRKSVPIYLTYLKITWYIWKILDTHVKHLKCIYAYKLTKAKSKGYILILHCVSHCPLFLLARLQHHSQNNSYILILFKTIPTYWYFSNDNSSDDGINEITLEKSYHYYNLHVETCNNSSHGSNCQKVLLEHPANGLPGDLVIINLMIIFIIMIMIMLVLLWDCDWK